jgi:hypothetical protein
LAEQNQSKKSKKPPKSRASIVAGGILAIAGGALIVTSGFRTSSFLISAAEYSQSKYGSELPGIAQSAVHIALLALSFVIGFGGLLAVLGGGLVLSKHSTVGKVLIGLGGGFGFIGIAISLGYAIFENGFSILLLHVDYWVGVLVASIGRYLA